MQIVADTNTVLSGLLWQGPPREILNVARGGQIQLFTSAALLAELEDVLQRPKFAQRLLLAGTSARELCLGYSALALLVKPTVIEPVVSADPDDDEVLACAIAAQAEAVVSGDSHLLDLKQYQGISIIRAAELLVHLAAKP